MKMPPNLHADEWKSGTEALAMCMICGGEYPPATQECPDCHVSLSVVRRCPSCGKIVSAQHKKCVFCRVPFVTEIPKPLPELGPLEGQGPSAGVRRFRAAVVSISTFLIVFVLGMFFVRQMSNPALTVTVIARASMVHSAPLRRTPTSSSSNLGKISPGNSVNLTGFQENDQGRWVALDWSGRTAYVPAGDISAPHAVEAGEGANALEFYISGMETFEQADGAAQAVDEYAKSFPGNAHLDELRWALGDRLRSLGQRGGTQAAELRRRASEQFEQLAAGHGRFAEKARTAMAPAPASAHPAHRTRAAAPKKETLQIITGSGTRITTAPSPPHAVEIH